MAEDNGTTPTPDSPTMAISVEEMIESSMGNINSTQIIQAILASIPSFFENQQTFISVFTDAMPSWHCTTTGCTITSDICALSKNDWDWDHDDSKSYVTIISEWDLECSSSFIKGLPATSYFVGCLLGGFALSTLGDSSLGRKNLVFISCLIMSFSAIASAFSPNVWVYSLLRFISGVGRVSITTSAFVLLSERVGKRWRGQIVLFGFVGLTFGLLALVAIAYLTRGSSWRTLYLYTAIPAFVWCTLVWFFVYESPRWLFLQGREKEAVHVLNCIAYLDQPNMVVKQGIPILKNGNPFSSIRVLVKKRWAIQRLLISMALSFGLGLIYFGMFLGVGGLGFNIYLMTTFNALLFLSASLLTYLFWIQRCNRRSSLLGFCTISGIASIISSIVGHYKHKGMEIGLELLSLFCASMLFNIVFMYVVEMFPTCVRNSATSLSRQALLFASVFVPVLVAMGGRNVLFSHAVFGVVVLLSGVLVVFLPETKGKALCDTLEEQEVMDGNGF